MKNKKPVLNFRSVFLSDVHLGSPDCQIEKVNYFLKHVRCEKLILNGDIIDGWSLSRRGGWSRKHTRFVRHVLKMIDKRRTEVIYLRGNHDDILDRFLPLDFGGLRIVDHYIHTTETGNYLVIHGDAFDAVTQNSKFVAVAGAVGYETLLRMNRIYNRYRSWRGKTYFSLSKAIKSRTKSVVNYISRFEDQVVAFAERYQCSGFICGHIHTPEDKYIKDIHYLNSGDWVESNTALVEHFDGRFEVIAYETFLARLTSLNSEPNLVLNDMSEIDEEENDEEEEMEDRLLQML